MLARAYDRAGRYDRALAVIDAPRSASVEGQRLRARMVARLSGATAADVEYRALTSREPADAAWYLEWADAHGDSPDARRILQAGTQRFPADALLQERWAVAAWAAGDRAAALRSADAALAADSGRAGAWFVKVAAARDRPSEYEDLVRGFEVRFADAPTTLLGMGDALAALARSPQDAAALRALDWTARIQAQQPELVAAAVTRARLLASLGRASLALSDVDKLIAHRPAMVEAHKLRAELLMAEGRHADAVAAYDRLLAIAPGNLAARRQQARIDGWRGSVGSSLERYSTLLEDGVPAIEAEAAAKRAYYRGDWREAVRRYDAWLALEPNEIEARLERAQSLDHLGETLRAADAYRSLSLDNRVAAIATERVARRRAPSVDLFAVGTSADGVERRQLLDVVDTGAAFSSGFGPGLGTRARVYGGPSFASAGGRTWRGRHVGGELIAAVAPPVEITARVAHRSLDGANAQWFGDAQVTWRASSSFRATAGVERTLVLENASTLVDGLVGSGPIGRLRWQPGTEFSAEISASRLALDDDNARRILRADLSRRVVRGSNELRLLASSEQLAYEQGRDSYFTPTGFWRHDAGVEWRGLVGDAALLR